MIRKVPTWVVQLAISTAIGVVSATIGWGRGIDHANANHATELAVLTERLTRVMAQQDIDTQGITNINTSLLAVHAEIANIALAIGTEHHGSK